MATAQHAVCAMASAWTLNSTCSRLGCWALLAEGPLSSLLAVGAGAPDAAMTRRLHAAPIGSATLPAQHARVAMSPGQVGGLKPRTRTPRNSPLQRGDGVARVAERRLAVCMVLGFALAASSH